jgi:hypothetical protein
VNDAAHARAFSALHRLLLVVDPEYGEGRWQWTHSFDQLAPELRSPGHWYRGQGRGFIHVDENVNGEYLVELPSDVDPATVIEVPQAQHTTVLETMRALLPHIDGARQAHFRSVLDELEQTASKNRAQIHVRNFQQLAFAARLASPETLLQYLAKSADFHNGDGLRQGSASGIEAAATLLIRALADGIAGDAAKAARIWSLLVAPGAQSIEALAAQMVRDCIVNGFSEQVYDVLAAVLREGSGLVDGAREGLFPIGHPEMMLDLYYFGLFGAAPYLRAAMVGYEVSSRNPDLDDKERRLYATRANAAEEKLARVSDAMMFAVRDLDGSQARSKRAAIQALLAAGETDKAEGLAMEAVDLKFFFPKPFKQVLLRPDPKA